MAARTGSSTMSTERKQSVNQDKLRNLMKEKMKSNHIVNSPLAKYNNLGQLICVLCNSRVKSELIWTAHVNSKTHKSNLAELKKKKDGLSQNSKTEMPPPPSTVILKRKLEDSSSAIPEKKVKGISAGLQKNSEQNSTSKASLALTQMPSSSSAKASVSNQSRLIANYSDSSSSDEDDDDQKQPTKKSKPSLPPDFFDSGIADVEPMDTSIVADEKVDSKRSNTAEALPEGFFDDPILDAKVRKVEYKNPMEEEWEKFQKAIAEETTVSQALMEEEDEESKAERQIDEIDEQIHNWARVEALQRRKDELARKQQNPNATDDADSSEDEQEFDEYLDWRSKGTWR